MKPWILLSLVLPGPLVAQLPPIWQHQVALGDGQPGAWWGGGLWAGDGQGPPATLDDALGIGNGITGSGVHLEGGWHRGNWDFAGEVLAVKEPTGAEYLTLYRSHAWWKGPSGWQGGFEQEPLVWGYGLNGGYVLGEAARPFPRLRIEAPYRPLSLFQVPLGSWGFQAFMGRLDNHRTVSASIQDPAWRALEIGALGDPQAPFLVGYRFQARFGSNLEFYINSLNLWGGTLNGVSMTQGYTLSDYLTAITGLKDTIAEGAHDPSTAPVPHPYRNKAQSASEVDWGIRLDSPSLARVLGAEHAWLTLSRGSKSMGWPIGVFLKNPPKYLLKDAGTVTRNLTGGKFGFGWNYNAYYSVPSEITPNDMVGVLLAWPRIRLGLEYLDTANAVDQGHRTFASPTYLSGFYYYGDPLGNAVAGEARTTTAKFEADVSRSLTSATWLLWGNRPFRDALGQWLLRHPDAAPGKDRIFGLQEHLLWRLSPSLTLDSGAAWMRHGAVDYEAGRTGNGFRWFTNLSCRWPAAR